MELGSTALGSVELGGVIPSAVSVVVFDWLPMTNQPMFMIQRKLVDNPNLDVQAFTGFFSVSAWSQPTNQPVMVVRRVPQLVATGIEGQFPLPTPTSIIQFWIL